MRSKGFSATPRNATLYAPLAAQFTAAQDWSRAVQYAIDAGDWSRTRNVTHSALYFYRLGRETVAHLNADERQRDLHDVVLTKSIAELHMLMNQLDDAEREFNRVVRLARRAANRSAEAEALAWQSAIRARMNRMGEAVETADAALSAAGEVAEPWRPDPSRAISGCQFLKVRTTRAGGERRYVVKNTSYATDLIRRLSDRDCRERLLWEHSIFDRLPAEVRSPTVAWAAHGDGWALLMDDVSTLMDMLARRSGDTWNYLTTSQITTIVEALASIHAECGELGAEYRVGIGYRLRECIWNQRVQKATVVRPYHGTQKGIDRVRFVPRCIALQRGSKFLDEQGSAGNVKEARLEQDKRLDHFRCVLRELQRDRST